MRVSMAAIIHRARWNFNVDEADGVSRRDRLRVQVGHELATVQMPPHALLGVVIEPSRVLHSGHGQRTASAWPAHTSTRCPGDVQFHRVDGPWHLEAQQMAVEFNIAHERAREPSARRQRVCPSTRSVSSG
jgi:hypothetical protein